MRRRPSGAALAGLLLLAGCTFAESPASPSGTTPPGLCRLGPDEGPPLADRGIGGTGAPSAIADRGIGGTGAPMPAAARVQVAERGIGGTGIIAIITGFASICLGGMEVALDDAVPVTLNGQAVAASSLRAGHLAIVEAVGGEAGLMARSVQVRQEVSGPVESVSTSGRLRVAGQAVQISSGTFGARNPQVGQWVAVSGLRGPDGAVQATRIDLRAAGEVLVRGRATQAGGRLQIGGLEVRHAPAMGSDGFVTATGRYRAGVLEATQVEPDRLPTDPAAAFPEATRRILVESYVMAGEEGLRLGSGAVLPAPAGLGGPAPRRALVEFERQSGSGLLATHLRMEGPGPIGDPPPEAGRTAASAGGLQPAPVPGRPHGNVGSIPRRDSPAGRGQAPVRGGARQLRPADAAGGPPGPPRMPGRAAPPR
ncbi:hypothetical protein GXW74_00540 [Roseomonas eburnea]|uniref:DUF5666 domain-containing protein n=1 Tax=Neoroseomonas eburnea TaxID=1346889 RepID=A0A9X9X5H7_9PROT|nr:DUF5666 domain-containing protein [Neoroseomonas eburnea]MBR0678963.1 hypothetical protein [Neoroseomonas eburnea]